MRLIALALVFSACAGQTPSVAERDFARSELADIPLQSLDLVVVVAGPPRVSEGRFDVRGFAPVTAEAALLEGAEEPQTRDALASALERSLLDAGYQVRVLTARAPVPTSSTSSAAPPLDQAPAALIAGQTLDAIRGNSTSDAILVVRAVPVDRFTVDVGSGTRLEDTPLGRERVLDSRPVALEGRLLVGQAFLFDRESGLRLWSRQAPEYPKDGRLTKDHPFLGTGYVQAEGEAAAPQIVRATASSRAFGRVILADFPAAKAGDPGARAALANVDQSAARIEEAFFDEGHVTLELGAGWGLESSQVDLVFDDLPLPALGTGALSPFGIGRVAPRVGYVAPGGRFYAATVPIVLSPSSFGRTYVQDNPRLTESDPHRVLKVKIGSTIGAGLQLEVGQVLWLAPSLALVPRGGGFIDVWGTDVTPDPFADGGVHVRAGAVLGLDLWQRLGDRWFARMGGDGRIGGDIRGGFLVGGALTLGLGLLL